jgi:septal ring factor EnvC (AmiA/AmiB activator)
MIAFVVFYSVLIACVIACLVAANRQLRQQVEQQTERIAKQKHDIGELSIDLERAKSDWRASQGLLAARQDEIASLRSKNERLEKVINTAKAVLRGFSTEFTGRTIDHTGSNIQAQG